MQGYRKSSTRVGDLLYRREEEGNHTVKVRLREAAEALRPAQILSGMQHYVLVDTILCQKQADAGSLIECLENNAKQERCSKARMVRSCDSCGRSAVVAEGRIMSCIPVLLALMQRPQSWRSRRSAASSADCPPRYKKQPSRPAWRSRTTKFHPNQSSISSGSFVEDTRSLEKRRAATRHKSLPLCCWAKHSCGYAVIGWRKTRRK